MVYNTNNLEVRGQFMFCVFQGKDGEVERELKKKQISLILHGFNINQNQFRFCTGSTSIKTNYPNT